MRVFLIFELPHCPNCCCHLWNDYTIEVWRGQPTEGLGRESEGLGLHDLLIHPRQALGGGFALFCLFLCWFVCLFQELTSSRSNTTAPGGAGWPQDWVGEWESVRGYQTGQEGLRGDWSFFFAKSPLPLGPQVSPPQTSLVQVEDTSYWALKAGPTTKSSSGKLQNSPARLHILA